MKRVIGAILLSLFSLGLWGQKPEPNHAFKPGEVMEYDAYYNFGLVWIKLGCAKFTVELVDSTTYKYTVSAYNLPKWDNIFSINTVHSATSTLQQVPLTYTAITTQNQKHSEMRYEFDNKDMMVARAKVNEKCPDGCYKVFPFEPYSQDIINSIYVARNVDLTQNGGKDIPFHPIYDDQVITVYGSVVGEEKIKTREGESYDCIKCMTMPPENTMFDAKEPVYIWLSNDVRKIPILVEAKIMIGRLKVYLKKYTEGGEPEVALNVEVGSEEVEKEVVGSGEVEEN